MAVDIRAWWWFKRYAQVRGLGWNVYLANFIAIVQVSLWNSLLNVKVG
jgi:hypothetical protein